MGRTDPTVEVAQVARSAMQYSQPLQEVCSVDKGRDFGPLEPWDPWVWMAELRGQQAVLGPHSAGDWAPE